MNELPVLPARQIDVATECVPRLAIALSFVPIAVGPTRIVVAVTPALIWPLPFVAGTASERPSVVIVSVARARSRLTPVVIALAVVGTAAPAAARRVAVPLIVARIVVARIEVKHRDLRMNQFS
jgi:hypothetical protein